MLTETQTNGALALEQKNRVIIIPAQDEITARKLRVAAYARVSSSSEDQLNSYRAQNQYYSEHISNNPDWEMVDIYADSGITGTSVDKREDFKRMMADCRKGKIDRILVKSILRFARNTKDCLAAVRELKELGVSVLFEEQGIDTARVSSEMVTAIMASLAQKQSESISGNTNWGIQRRMENGKFRISNYAFHPPECNGFPPKLGCPDGIVHRRAAPAWCSLKRVPRACSRKARRSFPLCRPSDASRRNFPE